MYLRVSKEIFYIFFGERKQVLYPNSFIINKLLYTNMIHTWLWFTCYLNFSLSGEDQIWEWNSVPSLKKDVKISTIWYLWVWSIENRIFAAGVIKWRSANIDSSVFYLLIVSNKRRSEAQKEWKSQIRKTEYILEMAVTNSGRSMKLKKARIFSKYFEWKHNRYENTITLIFYHICYDYFVI